jgi:Protein of unknown function (DUF3892)
MNNEVYITAIEVSEKPPKFEHITKVKFLNPSGTTGTYTTAKMVEHLAKNDNVSVGGPNGPAKVRVVQPKGGGDPYLRTTPDGTTADNLLSLPYIR